MEQREITDAANVKWTCVQAYSGTEQKTAEQVTEKTQESGKVQVVCTPSGGAQTVRLDLVTNWMEKLSDAELLDQITSAQQSK